MSKWFSVLALFVSLIIPAVPASANPINVVTFNEVRLGGSEIELADETKVKEYFTLYNAGSQTVSLDGWFVEYAKNPQSGLDPQFCEATSWVGFSNITVSRVPLMGELAANGVSQPTILQLNDSGSGSLRLIHETADVTTVHDLVGWGNDAPCQETSSVATPSSGKSIIRYVDCDEKLPIDTNNNLNDFAQNQESTPGKSSVLTVESCTDPTETENCESVAVTEMLPNPSGTDAGNEFIEVHNPTKETISLEGCGLFVGGDEFWFTAGDMLEPGQYKAFYDSVTKIGLTNSKGLDVLVITKTQELIQTSYPADMKDDFSWSLIEGVWQQTDNPTPNAANQPMTPEEPGKGASSGLGRCPAGKFRNPLTNRCKSIALATAALTPCKPGQVRNPETNRCRSAVSSSGSSLVPCKPGQERNPETNRCRKIGGSDGKLKPCAEDEERNPETNRCRKKQEALAAADIADKVADENKDMLNYGILGLAGFSVLGYGAYEYRNDFRNKFLSLKSKIFPDSSGK